VRDDRYKLIEYVVGDEPHTRRTTQLFDLVEDPWERENLADDPGSTPEVTRLREELVRWRDELDDSQRSYGAAFSKGFKEERA
jgi:arylsulfatase A-like enzyme